MQKILLLISCIIMLSSCQMALLNTMIKDPKVESAQSILEFQHKHNYDISNNYLLQSDAVDVPNSLMLSFNSKSNVFDSQGNAICYIGKESCSGTQFIQLLTYSKDSFQTCENDTNTLEKLLNTLVDFKNQPIEMHQLPKSDYYVVQYWAKFMGGKRGYNDAVVWMEQEIDQNSGSTKVTLIKVNTDLRESWGMKPKGKAKLKFKLRDEKLKIQLDKIPYK